MSRNHILSALAGFLPFFTVQASAQLSPANPDSALIAFLQQLKGTPLSLSDAIRHSLESSPNVLLAEASLASARGVVRRESGMFDPEVSLQGNYADQEIPTASFFAGAAVLLTVQASGSAGLRWDLPTGTSLQASLDAVRLTTNSAFAFLSPQYTTGAAITLRQPLLRGFTISARKSLTSAEQELEAAQARYNHETLLTATEVENLYWDLYAAERDYAVQNLTRDRAAAFLRETELRAQTGLIGPNQVANARTFLAEQEILLLDREELLDGLSDRLAAGIGMRPDSGVSRFRTLDQPRGDFPAEDADGLVREAIARNLALHASRSDIDARRTLARAATWEALPTVNLIGSLGGNGLAGTARDVVFGSDTLRTTVSGGLGDAISQSVSRDFPTWSVGFEVNVPIGLRTGLGEADRLEAEVAYAEQRYEQEVRILETEVRSGIREVANGQRRLTAAREGVQAAQEQVRIGIIEFQNGRTTAFELVRLGADFAVAQQRYSQALVRSAKAAAVLRLLTSGAYPSGLSSREQ